MADLNDELQSLSEHMLQCANRLAIYKDNPNSNLMKEFISLANQNYLLILNDIARLGMNDILLPNKIPGLTVLKVCMLISLLLETVLIIYSTPLNLISVKLIS